MCQIASHSSARAIYEDRILDGLDSRHGSLDRGHARRKLKGDCWSGQMEAIARRISQQLVFVSKIAQGPSP